MEPVAKPVDRLIELLTEMVTIMNENGVDGFDLSFEGKFKFSAKRIKHD
jgi:hypothetical protein